MSALSTGERGSEQLMPSDYGVLLAVNLPDVESICGLWGRPALRLALKSARELIVSAVRKTDIVAEIKPGTFVVFAKSASIDNGHIIGERIATMARTACVDFNEATQRALRLEIKGMTETTNERVENLLHLAALQSRRVNENMAPELREHEEKKAVNA